MRSAHPVDKQGIPQYMKREFQEEQRALPESIGQGNHDLLDDGANVFASECLAVWTTPLDSDREVFSAPNERSVEVRCEPMDRTLQRAKGLIGPLNPLFDLGFNLVEHGLLQVMFERSMDVYRLHRYFFFLLGLACERAEAIGPRSAFGVFGLFSCRPAWEATCGDVCLVFFGILPSLAKAGSEGQVLTRLRNSSAIIKSPTG